MEYTILEKKPWVFAEGCYPTRVVLLKLLGYKEGEYTTHLQVDATKDGGSIHLAHGHYFTELQGALDDFKTREV